jgi:hypothetical protein
VVRYAGRCTRCGAQGPDWTYSPSLGIIWGLDRGAGIVGVRVQSNKSTWIVWGMASGATTLFAILGMSLAAALESLSLLGVGGPTPAAGVALFGDSLAGLVAAVAIAYVVWHLDEGLPRSTWALVGAALVLGVIADALWAYAEVAMGQTDLGANLGDFFYFASYLLLALAIVRWILAYRGRIDLAWIATETVVVCAAIGATMWVAVLAPAMREIGPLAPWMIDDLAWVVLDLPMIIAPLVALALVLVRLKDSTLITRWTAFYAAMTLMVLADFGWFWERSHGGWHPGSLANFGFMASSILLAVGALTALDIQNDQAAKRSVRADLAA